MTDFETRPLDPRKEIASIFLLPDCNMSCRFCASETDFSVMSWSQAEDLLLWLRERGVKNLVLGGGEPFLWPHGLLQLCARAREWGFLVQVCTNATRLPEGYAQVAAIDRFVLPLEALDASIHDHLRHHPGGHQAEVLEALERLMAADRPFTISTVVTRTNVEGLSGLANFLGGLQARGARLHAWHLYRFLPVGRSGRANADRLDTTFEVFLRASKGVQALNLGFPVYRRSDMLQATSVAYFWADANGLQSSL